MTLTNSDILTYILTNRLHAEAGEYLLQEKIETMGEDAVGSARTWLYGRFLNAGETTLFHEWTDVTFNDLIPTNLSNIEAVRAAYLVLTTVVDTTSVYTMLFESFIRLSVAYIWQAAGMEGEKESEELIAQELIVAIVGALANPANILGDDGDGMDDPVLGAMVTVHALTADEIKEYTGGYE